MVSFVPFHCGCGQCEAEEIASPIQIIIGEIIGSGCNIQMQMSNRKEMRKT